LSGAAVDATLGRVNDEEILQLLPVAAAMVAVGDDRADAQLARLGGFDERDQQQVDRCVGLFLTRSLRGAWERGWTPADVVQYGRRELEAGVEPLLRAAIAAEHRIYPDGRFAAPWLGQLADLGIEPPYPPLTLTSWAAEARVLRYVALRRALALAGFLHALPILPRMWPLPGAVQDQRRGRPADTKMLSRIRALLAKAEATEFPDEAEALSSKAQELMAKFSLDSALLAADAAAELDIPDDTAARRLWVDTPYVSAKAQLVGAVASANRCRTVVVNSLAMVTVIGAEVDLRHTEILSTSLLVQANRAMLAAGKHVGHRGESRTRSFRQSFLMAYALRIGERLEATTAAAEAAVAPADAQQLLPVLARREEQVDALFTKLFPHTKTQRIRVTNGAGWDAGRIAADQALLDGRRQVRR
jgi:hypothetical protein